MFPFCSFYPLYTDTQPIFLFPILIYIISLKKLFLNLINVYFLLFSIFCLFYIDLNSTAITLNKIFSLFLTFLAYFYFGKNINKNRYISSYVTVSIFIHIISCIFQYFNPSLFDNVTSFIISDLRNIDVSLSNRGFTGLTPEPLFLGGLALFYLALTTYNKRFQVNHYTLSLVDLYFYCFCRCLCFFAGTLFFICLHHKRSRTYFFLTLTIISIFLFAYRYKIEHCSF